MVDKCTNGEQGDDDDDDVVVVIWYGGEVEDGKGEGGEGEQTISWTKALFISCPLSTILLLVIMVESFFLCLP